MKHLSQIHPIYGLVFLALFLAGCSESGLTAADYNSYDGKTLTSTFGSNPSVVEAELATLPAGKQIGPAIQRTVTLDKCKPTDTFNVGQNVTENDFCLSSEESGISSTARSHYSFCPPGWNSLEHTSSISLKTGLIGSPELAFDSASSSISSAPAESEMLYTQAEMSQIYVATAVHSYDEDPNSPSPIPSLTWALSMTHQFGGGL